MIRKAVSEGWLGRVYSIHASTCADLENLDRHVLDFKELAACIRGEREYPYSKNHDYRVQRTVLLACNVEV